MYKSLTGAAHLGAASGPDLAEAEPVRMIPLSPSTRTLDLYDKLRDDLLSGRLKPGQKLQMRFLMDAYQAGQTPLREALNRLTSEGLVEVREQRGFLVSPVSRSELQELTMTRCWIEALALRKSMEAANPAWEEALVVAHHRLSRTPRSLNPVQFEDNPEWERLHRIFHRTLVSQCGSNPLMGFCDHLADQLYRYRRVSIRRAFPTRKVADEHQAIMAAVLEGDVERAVGLLERHYQQTANVILEDPSL